MLQLTILSLFLLGNTCRDAYLDKVLRTQHLNGYFLVIKANVDGTQGDISVINDLLYEHLRSTDPRITDIDSYVSFMKQKIEKDEPIQLKAADLKKLDAGFLQVDPKVLANTSMSNDEFLAKYFYVDKKRNYARMVANYSPPQIGTLLKVLFARNYLITIVEGRYSIEDLNFCDLIAPAGGKN